MRRVFSVAVCLCAVLVFAGCTPTAPPDLSGSTAPSADATGAPVLTGLSASEASAALAAAGLKLGSVVETYSATVPEGQIISVNPVPGAGTPKGTPVEVIVSKGPGVVTVPRVIGKVAADAKSILTAAGFKVATTIEVSDATEGTVIKQDPSGGTAKQGTSVALTISTSLTAAQTTLRGAWKGSDGTTYTFRYGSRATTPGGGTVRYRLAGTSLMFFHSAGTVTAGIAWVSPDEFTLRIGKNGVSGPAITYKRVK